MLATTYLFHDDWVHRVARPWDYRSTPSFLHLVLMGRPVCSACTFVHFSLFATIDGAWAGRLAVVLELAAAAIATSRFFLREGIDRWVAAAWSFSLLALPGALAIGYWLGIGCLALGWLFAVLAALAAQQSLRSHRPLVWSLLAVGLLAASFATHQQIATIYVALLAAPAARAESAMLWPTLRRFLLIGAAAAGTYIAGYAVFAGIAFPDIYARYQAMDLDRTAILSDPASGLAWLATRLLPRATALWFDDVSLPWAPLIGMAALAVAFSLIRLGGAPKFGLRLAVILGLLLLAGAPTVLTGYRLETYRLALPISVAIVAALAASYGRGWADRLSALGLALALGFYAASRLATMIAPAERETAALRTGIAAAGERRDAPVEIVVPSLRTNIRTDEFSLVSTRFPFNARDAVTVIRREQGLAPVEVRTSEGRPSAAAASLLVIDLRASLSPPP